jgi:hypothetical protein
MESRISTCRKAVRGSMFGDGSRMEAMQPNEREETDEEFLARLAAKRAKRKAAKAAAAEAAKPQLTLKVSTEAAERARARPEVRFSTVRKDETVVIERARVTEIIQPLEVDGQARVARARHIDCATGEASIVEYRDGYRLPGGAVSDYNPLDGLRRPEDE